MAKNGQRCGENGQNLTKFQIKCYWLKLVTTAYEIVVKPLQLDHAMGVKAYIPIFFQFSHVFSV